MAASKAKKLEFTCTTERETKNKVRYQEQTAEGEDFIVDKLYLSKVRLADIGNPRAVKVTVEPA
jgi:hypothetical protein